MIVRLTARVIALDPGGRALLFECEDANARAGDRPLGIGGPRTFWVKELERTDEEIWPAELAAILRRALAAR
jgi:hypothetical protein